MLLYIRFWNVFETDDICVCFFSLFLLTISLTGKVLPIVHERDNVLMRVD